jgi:hypothetical protein
MSRESPAWGAPRIPGERLLLGIDAGETSVGKFMVQPPEMKRDVGIPQAGGWHHRFERRAA